MRLKFLVAFALLATIATHAQRLSFDNVKTMYIRNSGSIFQQKEIKGYFFFYESDKIDKKTNEYTLQILDQNLNKVKEIKMQESNDFELLESSYNGDALSFLFHDYKAKTLETRLYDMEGKKLYTYTRQLDKKTENFLSQYKLFSNQDYTNQQMFSVDGKGFITMFPIKEGSKRTYEVQFNSSLKNKQWVYAPSDEEKYSEATILSCTDSIVVLEVAKRTKAANKPKISIVGLNFETQKKAFEIEEGEDEYIFLPEYCTNTKGGNNLLIGPYYNKKDNLVKDFSKGIAIYVIDNNGKTISKAYNNWASDIGKYLPLNEKGKIDDIGYLFFHNVIQASNGSSYVIGEGYKRVADGFGIANNILSGGLQGGNTKIKITDMVVLEFGPDYKIKSASIHNKRHSDFLNNAIDLYSQHAFALIIKAMGSFDYAFTLSDKEANNFSFCYRDYEKSSEYKGQTFNMLRFTGKKFVTDKIQLTTKATNMKVLPAKLGYVMIQEYFRKEKKISLRLEKVN